MSKHWAGQGRVSKHIREQKVPTPTPPPPSVLPCQESSYTELAQNYQLSSTVEPTPTQKGEDSVTALNIYFYHYLLVNRLSEINFHNF